MIVLAVIFTLVVVAGAASGLHVVPAYYVDVVERLGRVRELRPGVHWILRGVDRRTSIRTRPTTFEVAVRCTTVDASPVHVVVCVTEQVVEPLAALEHLDQLNGGHLVHHVVGSVVGQRSDDDTRLKRDELAESIRWAYEPLRRSHGFAVERLTISQVAFEPVVAASQLGVLLAQNERAVQVLKADTDRLIGRTRAETEATAIVIRDRAVRGTDDRSLEWRRLDTIHGAMPDATIVLGRLPWQPPQAKDRRPPPEPGAAE